MKEGGDGGGGGGSRLGSRLAKLAVRLVTCLIHLLFPTFGGMKDTERGGAWLFLCGSICCFFYGGLVVPGLCWLVG